MTTPKEINDKLQELVDRGDFGKTFRFRDGQRYAIVKICWHILNKTKSNVIINAPTGSGKSIISIVTARLLTQGFGLTGYIIASDLGLQDQYMNDIDIFRFNWGCVKGVDNYSCSVNGKQFSIGECRSRGLGMDTIKKLDCYNFCDYLQSKQRAMDSDVTVLNYSYWLIQRNYTAKKELEKGVEESFPKRDFCLFDEAHKVDDIVQNHFAPRLTYKLIEVMEELNVFLAKNSLTRTEINKSELISSWNKIIKPQTEDVDIELLNFFKKTLVNYISFTPKIKNRISINYPFGKNIPLSWSKAVRNLEFLKDTHCKIEDYLTLANNETLVKTITTQEAIFNVLDDRSLIKYSLHEQSEFSVFLSATFGNCKQWAELTNTENYDIINVPVNWDWNKSPIFEVKGPRLNYTSKEENLPIAIKLIDELIDRHPNEKGIVHSGSYTFTETIIKNSRHKNRFITYKNSEEKREILEYFYKCTDAILIGPSLIEGIDLRDDLSRFQIFFKVPYRSLTDEYIKKKMKVDTDWYNWKTLIQFIQGLGRSVRNENDYATTYLLDGCFSDFIKKNLYLMDEIIIERIKNLK